MGSFVEPSVWDLVRSVMSFSAAWSWSLIPIGGICLAAAAIAALRRF